MRYLTPEDLQARHRLMRGARPVQCKTGLGTSRAANGKHIHRVQQITAAYADGRIRYFADWTCGDTSLDAVIVADADLPRGMCPRCELAGWFVYHCYDAASLLLYIGSTGDQYTRFSAHAKNTPWWPEVADIRKTQYPDETAAREAETAAIAMESPLHNKRPGPQAMKRAA